MKIISNINEEAVTWDKCVLTMGDFDGIHKGHRSLIEKTIRSAKEKGLPPVLLTYDPSPKKVLQKLDFDNNLYTREEKIRILRNYPLHAVIFFPFDERIAHLSAKNFLINVLLNQLNCVKIVIGYDHKFGFNRHGGYKYLKLASKKYNFEVEKIKPIRLFRQVASSSLIRRLLREGKIHAANQLLLAPYMMQGTVIQGQRRGSLLGFPTANLDISKGKIIPREGVYLCMAELGGQYYKAVVNIGSNPTFQNKYLSVEAHILDFNASLYGEKLTLFFSQRIRDEKKFPNAEELVKQIHQDIAYSKKLELALMAESQG